MSEDDSSFFGIRGLAARGIAETLEAHRALEAAPLAGEDAGAPPKAAP